MPESKTPVLDRLLGRTPGGTPTPTVPSAPRATKPVLDRLLGRATPAEEDIANQNLLNRGLEILGRPSAASAGFAYGLASGEDPFEKARLGLTGEGQRYNYADVLGKMGLEEGVPRNVLGFIGDVALDPTMWIPGVGVVSAAKVGGKAGTVLRAAEKAQALPFEMIGKGVKAAMGIGGEGVRLITPEIPTITGLIETQTANQATRLGRAGAKLRNIPGAKAILDRLTGPTQFSGDVVGSLERLKKGVDAHQAGRQPWVSTVTAPIRAMRDPFQVVDQDGLRLVNNVSVKKPGASLALGDIMEHPDWYNLTPEQLAYRNQAVAINKTLWEYGKKRGLDLTSLGMEEGDVFPRFVLGRAPDGTVEVISTRRTGTAVGAAENQLKKHRFYETQLEGMQAKLVYEEDAGAILSRLARNIYSGVGDKELSTIVKGMVGGIRSPKTPALLKEAVEDSKTFYEAITNLEQAVQRARRGEILPASVISAAKFRFPTLGQELDELVRAAQMQRQKISGLRPGQPEELGRLVADERMSLEQVLEESYAERDVLKEVLANDPVANYTWGETYTRRVGGQLKTFTRQMGLDSIIPKSGAFKGQWPESVTQKQAENLMMGRKPSPSSIRPDGRVRWEYVMDELTQHFGMADEDELIAAIERVAEQKAQLAELPAQIKGLEARYKELTDLSDKPLRTGPAMQAGMGFGERSQGQLMPEVLGEGQKAPLADAEQLAARQARQAEIAKGQAPLPEADALDSALRQFEASRPIPEPEQLQRARRITYKPREQYIKDSILQGEEGMEGTGFRLDRKLQTRLSGEEWDKAKALVDNADRAAQPIPEAPIPERPPVEPIERRINQARTLEDVNALREELAAMPPSMSRSINAVSLNDIERAIKGEAGISKGAIPPVEPIGGMPRQPSHAQGLTQLLERVRDTKAATKDMLAEARQQAKLGRERTAFPRPGLETYLTPRAFGGSIAPIKEGEAINRLFGPQQTNQVLQGLSSVTNAVRMFQTGFDLGGGMIQLLPIMFRRPDIWGKAQKLGFEALVDPTVWPRFQVEHAAVYERLVPTGMLAGGAHETTEALRQVGRVGRIFQEGPLSKVAVPAGRKFEIELEAARVFLGESLLPLAARDIQKLVAKGVSQEAAQRQIDGQLAGFLNKITGVFSSQALGISSTQRQVEAAVLFFSPRYLRATFALLGDIANGGLAGREAMKSLGAMMAGGLISYQSMARALGQQANLDPREGKFLTLKLGDTWVGPGSGWVALARAAGNIAKAVETPSNFALGGLVAGKQDWRDILETDPFWRYWRGRSAPLTGNFLDILTNETVIGDPVQSPEDFLRVVVARDLAPFWLAEMVQPGPEAGIVEQPMSAGGRALNVAAGLTGLRAWPVSEAETRNNLRENYANLTYGKEWTGLTRPEKDVLEQAHDDLRAATQTAQVEIVRRGGPRAIYEGLTKQIENTKLVRGQELDKAAKAVIAGQMAYADYAKVREESMTKYGNQTEMLYQQREAAAKDVPQFQQKDLERTEELDARDRYYQISLDQFRDDTGQITDDSWSAFEAAQKRFLNTLTPTLRKYVVEHEGDWIQALPPAARRIEMQRKADYALLEQYWQIGDDAWKSVPTLAAMKKRVESEQNPIQRIGLQKMANAQGLQIVEKIISARKDALRYTNPAVDAALYRWGYVSKPITLRGL